MDQAELPADQRRHLLVMRRTTLLASLGRADQFLQRFEEGRDGFEVAIRLENLEEVWRDLGDVQNELETTESSNEGMMRNLSYRSSFETQYFRIKAGMISKLPPPINQTGNIPTTSTPHSVNTLKGLKLPTITLPDFNGDYKEWLAFHDTFLALIHSNPDLPDIQKFHYLRAAVKGEAAQVIESISISAVNYGLAWQALIDRYANEYLLKKRHLQGLIDIPRMVKETATSLHGMVDEFERHVKILKQLREPTDAWSTILEHLLCTRLHDDSLKAWEDHASTISEPSYQNLIEFLQRRMRVLESISVNQQLSAPNGTGSTNVSVSRRAAQSWMSTSAAIEDSSNKCSVCAEQHSVVKCPRFSNLSLQDRMNLVNTKRLCSNCLRANNFVRRCSSRFSCRSCQKRHHTLLHPGFPDASTQLDYNPPPSGSGITPIVSNQVNIATTDDDGNGSVFSAVTSIKSDEATNNLPLHRSERNVFMLTVVLIVVDRFGKQHFARALLDSASQPNLMTERMAQLLRLKRDKANAVISGVGGQSQHARESVTVQVQSRKDNFSLDINFLVLRKFIPCLPSQDVSIDDWNLPTDIFLADPSFNKRGEIDMIIGNEHFFSCFETASRLKVKESLPLLVNSVFGWLVSGPANVIHSQDQPSSSSVMAISFLPLEESMERFWKVEELSKRVDYSEEEKECERLYSTTVTRAPNGRYVVRLPRRDSFSELIGYSRNAALHRFLLLERRLERDTQLKGEYHKFMHEYLYLGHMRKVNGNHFAASQTCYLPHHPVIKAASSTTKVRVVFDGSAKTTTGFSLNNALLVGPVIQDDLLSIVLRFRTFPVALVADVEKMYRQVLIHPDDAPLQRILWRFAKSDPVQEYELRTVTYGLGPSSFLATRTLQQLATDEGEGYPLAKPAVQKGFYVDDFIGGAQSIDEATQLRKELGELLSKGGFSLRKWTSNQIKVLDGLKPEQIGTQSAVKFDNNETVKALGIAWEPKNDVLRFDSQIRQIAGKPTKRTMLSAISQLFDPLGLVSPITVRAKMMMQQLWLLPCGWDDDVPGNIATKWEDYFNQLPKISTFRVDRYALLPNSSIQLHNFADASESAYGACTYARSVDALGNVRVQLLASKTRVAPLKRLSLPRLELCAAVLAARLHTQVTEALQIEISASYFWSDSMVTLQWLRSPPNTWQTFVANRVSEIQSTTRGAHWNHVAGSQNPADLLSRGMDLDEFLKSEVWIHGPRWLAFRENKWPISLAQEQPEMETERRKLLVAVTHVAASVNPIIARYSSFNRLIRSTAYCLRFIRNIRSKARTQPIPSTGPLPSRSLSVEELSATKLCLTRLAQCDAYREEIRDLNHGQMVSKHSPIRNLAPFVDSEGIIRVGGRLQLSDQPYLAKHPSLLPSFHTLSQMILSVTA